jgi:hypothetical protein
LILAALQFQRARALTDVEPMSIALSAATIFLATIQLYLLVRIEIDRQLFDALATASDPDDLAALDDALAVLGWSSPTQASRSLKARSLGAIRFVRLAGALTALQMLAAGLSLFLR